MAEYFENLGAICDEIKRVLKPHGTFWLNMGDTFSGSHCGSFDYRNSDFLGQETSLYRGQKAGKTHLEDHSLMMIPSRFVSKLCDEGWILCNEIIWHKKSCKPQSMTNRFTVDFEKVFFLVKNQKYYFKQQFERQSNGDGQRNKRCVWPISAGFYFGHSATFPEGLVESCIDAGCPENGVVLDPFCGSGTTLAVAKRMNRDYLGFDINPEYVGLAESRLQSILVES